MNYATVLGVMLILSLGTAEEEIKENCIPYGRYVSVVILNTTAVSTDFLDS